MPRPIEICLEELGLLPKAERYLRCVALPDGEPGLALDGEGAVRWMPEEPIDHGLWVSMDDQLILLRGESARPIAVSRGGRRLDAPTGKPVVLLDQDLLLVGDRRLRVHVHGATEVVHAPERLTRSALARVARAAATAIAFSASLGAGASQGAPPPPIEVREKPPGATAGRPVVCEITSSAPNKQGSVMVHARCPAGARIVVGLQGNLIDASGSAIKDGGVVVKEVRQDRIVAETRLRTPVKGSKVRFFVRH